MEDIGLGELFQLLNKFLGMLGLGSKPTSSVPSQNNNPSSFQGFRVPLRGTWYSSGGFDPTGKGSVGRPHFGVDLRQSGGSPIYPIAPGVVKYVRPDPKGGNTVVIDHQNGYSSYYAHCGTISVHPGDTVGYNDVIANVGASGNAKGFPHCHLQIWRDGVLLDPATVINIPAYKPFDSRKEKLWLSPEAKEIADNWSLKDHLSSNKSKRLT